MAKGAAPKDDINKINTVKPDVKDTLSPIDRGKDFIPQGGN